MGKIIFLDMTKQNISSVGKAAAEVAESIQKGKQQKGKQVTTKENLKNYPASVPRQMLLFQLDEKEAYGQSIDLYDSIPKYVWGNRRRIEGKFLDPVRRSFKYKGEDYKVVVNPAMITGKDGVARHYFPGTREEIIEDVLRRLASEGNGVFLKDRAGVIFSLYGLEKELKRIGHAYNKTQIKEALLVCRKTDLEIYSGDGKEMLSSNMFETLGLQDWEDWKGHENGAACFVRFNSMVTQSIEEKTFRLFNFDKCMQYKSVLARYLHKRLSRMFTYASLRDTYDVMLTRILEDSGIRVYADIRNNLREAEKALGELQDAEVIRDYQIEKVFGGQRGKKIVDAKIVFIPHIKFIHEMKNIINRRYKQLSSQTVEPRDIHDYSHVLQEKYDLKMEDAG